MERIHLVALWATRPTDQAPRDGGPDGADGHTHAGGAFDRWQCSALQDISEATEHVESWMETIAPPLVRVRFVMGTGRDDTMGSCPADASAGLGATSLWPCASLGIVHLGSGVEDELEAALHAWWPKLREGGLMAGVGWPETRRVVEAFLRTTATPAGSVREEGSNEGGWYVFRSHNDY